MTRPRHRRGPKKRLDPSADRIADDALKAWSAGEQRRLDAMDRLLKRLGADKISAEYMAQIEAELPRAGLSQVNREWRLAAKKANPVIFTPALLAAAQQSPRHNAPLLHQWARWSGRQGATLRRQIERAAATVPSDRRGRVLGQILSRSSSDDQVRAAIEVLLLAKMLDDQGWAVEFEPEEGRYTPDLRITKGDAVFVIEATRVAAQATSPSQSDLNRIADALAGITTLTPITITNISLNGSASLKPFRRHIRELLAGSPCPGPHHFHQGDVFVGFDVEPELSEPHSAYAGCNYNPIHGGQLNEVRARLNEKLAKYKFPLVVALHFFDTPNPFKAVEEVLFGRQVIQASVDVVGRKLGKPRAGRAADGLLSHRGDEGKRARARLQAVLAFTVSHERNGLSIRARVITNPASTAPLKLTEFVPIPRLVVVEETNGYRKLKYLDHRDRPFAPKKLITWRHVPL